MAGPLRGPLGVLGLLALAYVCDANPGSPGSATTAAAMKLRGFDELYKQRMQDLQDNWMKTKMKWAGKACLLDDDNIKVRAEAAMACPTGEATAQNKQEWKLMEENHGYAVTDMKRMVKKIDKAKKSVPLRNHFMKSIKEEMEEKRGKAILKANREKLDAERDR